NLTVQGGVNFKGTYDGDTTYDPNDAVSYQGSSYVAIQETTGNLPTDTDYWQLLAEKGETGATGDTGQGVPSGGTAGQVLAKIDGTDYNTEWVDRLASVD